MRLNIWIQLMGFTKNDLIFVWQKPTYRLLQWFNYMIAIIKKNSVFSVIRITTCVSKMKYIVTNSEYNKKVKIGAQNTVVHNFVPQIFSNITFNPRQYIRISHIYLIHNKYIYFFHFSKTSILFIKSFMRTRSIYGEIFEFFWNIRKT